MTSEVIESHIRSPLYLKIDPLCHIYIFGLKSYLIKTFYMSIHYNHISLWNVIIKIFEGHKRPRYITFFISSDLIATLTHMLLFPLFSSLLKKREEWNRSSQTGFQPVFYYRKIIHRLMFLWTTFVLIYFIINYYLFT